MGYCDPWAVSARYMTRKLRVARGLWHRVATHYYGSHDLIDPWHGSTRILGSVAPRLKGMTRTLCDLISYATQDGESLPNASTQNSPVAACPSYSNRTHQSSSYRTPSDQAGETARGNSGP